MAAGLGGSGSKTVSIGCGLVLTLRMSMRAKAGFRLMFEGNGTGCFKWVARRREDKAIGEGALQDRNSRLLVGGRRHGALSKGNERVRNRPRSGADEGKRDCR